MLRCHRPRVPVCVTIRPDLLERIDRTIPRDLSRSRFIERLIEAHLLRTTGKESDVRPDR